MDLQLRSTLVKVALPLLVITGALVASMTLSRKKGIPLKDFGFARPKISTLCLWVGLWIVWMGVTEMIIPVMGLDQAKPWPNYPTLIIALRIVAIGILGPAAEELLVRGVFFAVVSRRMGAPAAILVCAVAWALAHYHYGWGTVVLVVLDGIFLGAARHYSRSIAVPIAMHMIGNLFSIYQSLPR